MLCWSTTEGAAWSTDCSPPSLLLFLEKCLQELTELIKNSCHVIKTPIWPTSSPVLWRRRQCLLAATRCCILLSSGTVRAGHEGASVPWGFVGFGLSWALLLCFQWKHFYLRCANGDAAVRAQPTGVLYGCKEEDGLKVSLRSATAETVGRKHAGLEMLGESTSSPSRYLNNVSWLKRNALVRPSGGEIDMWFLCHLQN